MHHTVLLFQPFHQKKHCIYHVAGGTWKEEAEHGELLTQYRDHSSDLRDVE